MGRRTYEAEGADRLNQATGDAARILSGDLAACSKMLRAMLEMAAAEEGRDEKLAVIQGAVELAGAAVKMGDTIGRLKGEIRQHISVERNGEPTANAPQFAPKTRGSRSRTHRESAEISDFAAQNEGGGG